MSYFHPQQMPVLPARRREAARRQLEHVVKRSAKTGRRVRPSGRRPKPAVLTAVVAVVAIGAGAAFAVVQDQPVTNRSGARCYTVPDPNSSDYTTIAVAGSPTPGKPVPLSDALSVCALLFRQGFLRPDGAGIERFPDTSKVHQVPPLVACIMRDGTAAVFPGSHGICERIGLPAATGR